LGDTIIYKKVNKLDDLKSDVIPDFYSNYEICFDLSLDKLKSDGCVIFYNCIFPKNIYISSMNPNKSFSAMLEFEDCTFKGKIKCDNLRFDKSFIIKKIKEGYLNLECTNVVFNSAVVLKGITINNLVLNEVEFSEETFFYDVKFNNKLNFIDTYFYKNVYFDVSDILVENRRTARIIKDSFEQQNNIIEANKFYKLEMDKMEDELKWDEKPIKKLIFKIHGLSSNHSQNWILPFLLILIFGLIYSIFSYDEIINNVEDNKKLIDSINKHIDNPFQTILLWVLIFCSVSSFFIGIFKKELVYKYLFFTLLMGSFYIGYTNDIQFILFAYNINPFSIMTSSDILTGIALLFKITIAYLIYQLIVSIRQNTRRK